jgi:hypothetical protein
MRIPIALKVPMPFLQFKSGALHFADDIGFTFINLLLLLMVRKPVPAMGCVAMKFLPIPLHKWELLSNLPQNNAILTNHI